MRQLVLLLLLICTPAAQAGVHLSLENLNDLPARWRGFLPDLRRLRVLGQPGFDGFGGSTLTHNTYADLLLKLESEARSRPLAADELADLGALHLRLGAPEKALGVLRDARRKHPRHFAIAANLGTACQAAGDLAAAIEALDDAITLAPERWKQAEQAHRRLLHLRSSSANQDELDALFPDPPPPDALAITQQLALWLPADGRLLWQLGELAHRHGHIRDAANILDGCVTDFAMKSNTLRERRRKFRAEADALEAGDRHNIGDESIFKSSRALGRLFDEKKLPPVNPDGKNDLPWIALGETTIARPFNPQLLSYVAALDGRRVSLLGHMRPVGGEKAGQVAVFILTEFPIGCWFCDVPEPTNMIFIELKNEAEITRNAVRIEGVFHVNRDDPEDYLFRISEAVIRLAD